MVHHHSHHHPRLRMGKNVQHNMYPPDNFEQTSFLRRLQEASTVSVGGIAAAVVCSVLAAVAIIVTAVLVTQHKQRQRAELERAREMHVELETAKREAQQQQQELRAHSAWAAQEQLASLPASIFRRRLTRATCTDFGAETTMV